MAHPTPHPDPASVITRIARAIFVHLHPRAEWDDPAYAESRVNCELLAAQFREMCLQGVQIEPVQLWHIPSGQGISDPWREAFVAVKLAEVLAELAAGVPITALDANDRAWVRGHAEMAVARALDYFTRTHRTAQVTGVPS